MHVMSLNRAMEIGNLGSDPLSRSLPSGQPAVGFSIATDELFTDKQGQKQERVEWHQIVAFGKLAEICNEYLKKGRQVYLWRHSYDSRLATLSLDALSAFQQRLVLAQPGKGMRASRCASVYPV